MKMKTILVLMLAISGLLIGTAYGDRPKGYRINLITGGRVGTAAVEAGEYNLLVHMDEPKVQLEDGAGKVIDIPAKVETVDSKYSRTEVHSQKVDGKEQVNEIRIGGTKLRIEFRKAS
jgi:hypothetical protein